MSTNTTILTGNFTATGSNVLIPLVSGVTWMNVYNVTAINAAVNNYTVQSYWQLGMPAANGILYKYVTASTAVNTSYTTQHGFTLVDTSVNAAQTINATITAVSNAGIPVVTNTGVNGLSAGNIVRLFNITGAQQLGGLDFTVGYNTLSNTTFSLDYMAQITAGTAGSWALIPYDPIFYPRRRYITKISQAAQAVVTLSVTHGYQVGQVVRMVVPSAYGMSQMNGLQATIVAINTATNNGNTITLDIDSSAFNAFVFPLTAATPFSKAEVVPMGQDTAYSESQNVNILSDATVNTAQTGLLLIASGNNGVAGANGDQIYWQAGIGFSNNGE